MRYMTEYDFTTPKCRTLQTDINSLANGRYNEKQKCKVGASRLKKDRIKQYSTRT